MFIGFRVVSRTLTNGQTDMAKLAGKILLLFLVKASKISNEDLIYTAPITVAAQSKA
jgi:hypothetical protein